MTDGPVKDSNLEETRKAFESQWADLFIVSDVEVSEDAALYAKGSETPVCLLYTSPSPRDTR